MTQFWRDGYWRMSVHGLEHWVEGHWVDREHWDRSVHPYADAASRLKRARATIGTTSRYVSPNADCPICGAEVFFHQNEFGSRVYFDELGPPWPKHPCTDQGGETSRENAARGSAARESPHLRDSVEVESIGAWDDEVGRQREFEFGERHGQGRWQAYRVERKLTLTKGMALILSENTDGSGKLTFRAIARRPPGLEVADPVFLFRGQLAYLDHRRMEPEVIDARKVNSARSLINELVGR